MSTQPEAANPAFFRHDFEMHSTCGAKRKTARRRRRKPNKYSLTQRARENRSNGSVLLTHFSITFRVEIPNAGQQRHSAANSFKNRVLTRRDTKRFSMHIHHDDETPLIICLLIAFQRSIGHSADASQFAGAGVRGIAAAKESITSEKSAPISGRFD